MINLTEKAFIKLNEFKPDNNHRLRLSIIGGGCSGYMYQMDFEPIPSENNENDVVLLTLPFNVVTDNRSVPLLKGIELDYVDNLNETGFIFNNPNATKCCGCEKSFCG